MLIIFLPVMKRTEPPLVRLVPHNIARLTEDAAAELLLQFAIKRCQIGVQLPIEHSIVLLPIRKRMNPAFLVPIMLLAERTIEDDLPQLVKLKQPPP